MNTTETFTPLSAHDSPRTRLFAVVEFAVLFVVVPLVFWADFCPIPRIPALLAALLYCYGGLRRRGKITSVLLWNGGVIRRELPAILLRSLLVGAALIVYVRIRTPQYLFAFPRRAPHIWLIVMALYPVLSAYPQEFIYRAFFYTRYESVCGSRWVCVMASALAFAFLHLMFDNVFAVVSTLVAGAVFSISYARHRSLAAVSLEHAVYGCLAFTVGVGHYFYEGI